MLSSISVEAANALLEGNKFIIVALHGNHNWVLIWLDEEHGEFTGVYGNDVRKVFSNNLDESVSTKELLELLTKDIIDNAKTSYYAQRCRKDGWMRFFHNPVDIDCRGFRLYDLQSINSSSLGMLKGKV